jgi:hypothetical protein
MDNFTVTPTASTLTSATATVSTAALMIGGTSTQEIALRYPLAAAIGANAVTFESLCHVPAGTLAQKSQVITSTITFKVNAVGAIPINVDLWAKNFGAAVTNADYVPYSATMLANQVPAKSFSVDFLVFIKQLFNSATVAAAQVVTQPIPTIYLNADTTVNAGFTDFLLTPGAGFTAGATAHVTIEGTASVDTPVLAVKTASVQDLINDDVTERTQAIGAESYLAFGVEGTEGKPVKGAVYLDLVSSDFDANATNIQSMAIKGNRIGSGKMAVGAAMPGGTARFNITPNKWITLLAGFMGTPTNTVVNGAYRTETLKPAKNADLFSFTFIEKVGNIRRVFPGTKISSMAISVDMDAIIDASVTLASVDAFHYTDNDAGTADEFLMLSSAGYDTQANGLYSFTGASVAVEGVDDKSKFQNFSLTLDNMLNNRRSLNGRRTPAGHYTTDFQATVTFDLFFQDEIQLKNYMGALNKNGTWKPGKKIVYQNVSLTLLGEDCDNHQLVFNFPKLAYTTATVNVPGNEGIVIRCSATAMLSDADNTNVTMTVKHSNGATTWNKTTALRDQITVVPFNCSCC